MKNTALSVCLATFLFLIPARAVGQASINENLETAFIYVDGTTGSDSNAGTEQSPMKTIQAAVTLAITKNHQGLGTRVIINPGTYREAISLTAHSNDTSLPMTIEAAQSGTVVVNGAVPYTGWSPEGSNPSIYTTSWTNEWGLCPLPTMNGRWNQPGPFQQDVVRRREMIFVNGKQLTQVMLTGQMQPGTFSVNETTHLVYIWPPAGTNLNTADVEVATLPDLLSVLGKSNLVVRGLNFEYANTCRNNAAVNIAGGATNILLVADNVLWNNAGGLYVGNQGTANFTVQNVIANHNGQYGFGTADSLNGLWKTITSNYNNWRGGQGAYYVWNSAGGHFYSSHTDTISGYVVAYNQTHGIHWDTDVSNIKATGVVSAQNLYDGIFYEVIEGPASLSTSYVCSNNLGVHDQYLQAGGLELRNSEQISFTHNTLYNNGSTQINIQGVAGGITITNWQTGQIYNLVSKQFTHENNVVGAAASTQQLFFDSYLGGTDWNQFQDTLSSNENTWWNASNSSVFTVPFPKLGAVDELSAWQLLTSQDAQSSWSKPLSSATAPCAVPVDFPDYWITIDSASHAIADNTAVLSVSLVPVGAFTGNVKLSFDGVKEVTGLSAKLSLTSVAVPGSATLTVTAASNTLAGTYPITIIANQGGVTRTTTSSLVVP